MMNEPDRDGGEASELERAGRGPSTGARRERLRDLPDKFRELHWTLWLAEAELAGSTPEVSLDYLELLDREIREVLSQTH
jgi:hypothetical protein